MFWIVCCIPFQVVMSTETCGLFCSRFSHLPWLKHNSVTDAALAMRMTEQILCFLFILISLLQVSSLHLPASWPRNITGPSCFMRPTGQDSLPVKNAPRTLGFRCAHCTSKFDSRYHGLSSPKGQRLSLTCGKWKPRWRCRSQVFLQACCLWIAWFPTTIFRLCVVNIPYHSQPIILISFSLYRIFTFWTFACSISQILATASPYLLLDVPVFHRQLFGNTIF